jgi:cysteine desulfurase/selenocysteine lyase
MHPAVSNGSYDVTRIREDFPILATEVYGKPLVYLDNAASAQKPKAVLDRLHHAYTAEYANVHRGLHYLANAATEAYEDAREKVRAFLNAGRTEEIVFTRNATEAINLVAYTFGRERIQAGDEIVLSIMEHHSNIVPWHFLRERQGAVIKWAPVDDDGNFLIEEFEKLLSPRTKMVAITHMSNMIGTLVPVKEVVRTPAAFRSCSTGRRRASTSTSMCRTSAATSTWSPATSFMGRPASGCSTAATGILRPCRRSTAAAR